MLITYDSEIMITMRIKHLHSLDSVEVALLKLGVQSNVVQLLFVHLSLVLPLCSSELSTFNQTKSSSYHITPQINQSILINTFDGTGGHQAIDLAVLCLSNAIRAILCLQIVRRIPVMTVSEVSTIIKTLYLLNNTL